MNIKETLNLMASFSHDEYEKAKELGIVAAELSYENGFVYVKDNGDSYGIRVSFSVEDEFVYDDLKPFIESDKEKIYILLSGMNRDIYHQLLYKGFEEVYSSYELINHKESVESNLEGEVLQLEPYKEQEFLEYIRVLGSYSSMRKDLGLEPFDWYGSNHEEAKKKFQLHQETNEIFGHYVNGKLVGVGMLHGNEIDSMAIDLKHQEQGYGKKLLRSLMVILHQRGHRELFVRVMANNSSAIHLYRSMGFETKRNLTVLEKIN
jgi:ribosomal protein S18 acetylase RimI-like enzyme